MSEKAVFFDRDGTINVEKHYLYRIEDFEFLPGAVQALRMLKEKGFRLIIITNQSGIARGYYTEEQLKRLHVWVTERLKEQDIKIDAFYYCPHLPNAVVPIYRTNCNCRKPKLGMFERAVREFDIDLSRSFAIGDQLRDLAICASTNCRGYLIGENRTVNISLNIGKKKIGRISQVKDLHEAACEICALTDQEEMKRVKGRGIPEKSQHFFGD